MPYPRLRGSVVFLVSQVAEELSSEKWENRVVRLSYRCIAGPDWSFEADGDSARR